MLEGITRGRNGWRRTFLLVDQAFRSSTKLCQPLGESWRNEPLADCRFELFDQGNEITGQSLDLGCASILTAAPKGSSVWR